MQQVILEGLPPISAIDKALHDGRSEDLMRQVFNPQSKQANTDAHKKSAGNGKVA